MAASLSGVRKDVAAGIRYLMRIAAANGIYCRVTSGRRSRGEQERLYRNYVKGLSRFPAAKPGTSKHELGLAVDLAVVPEEVLPALGRLWESWGGTWGGRFKDPIHFEV